MSIRSVYPSVGPVCDTSHLSYGFQSPFIQGATYRLLDSDEVLSTEQIRSAGPSPCPEHAVSGSSIRLTNCLEMFRSVVEKLKIPPAPIIWRDTYQSSCCCAGTITPPFC